MDRWKGRQTECRMETTMLQIARGIKQDFCFDIVSK